MSLAVAFPAKKHQVVELLASYPAVASMMKFKFADITADGTAAIVETTGPVSGTQVFPVIGIHVLGVCHAIGVQVRPKIFPGHDLLRAAYRKR